ncbi:helix-turn-helix transcriptional regulator [Blastochloris viridis]|nr:hypothetical protein [Blastochloris viridis]ALK09493.1 hypothetical protein BVIR_1717 [Blastochloris viridis]CUU42156.1 hypothetical protein BVIRIDIS_11620 [Blastochloris viridis]
MNTEAITPGAFDQMTARPSKLWGLPAIAKALGCGVDKVRALALHPEVPIYRPAGAGTYFAHRAELEAWLRSKPSRDVAHSTTAREPLIG